jgi:hypothetical protein
VRPILRLAAAVLVPLAIAGLAIALRPTALPILAIAGATAAAIAVVTGLVAAKPGAETVLVLRRLLAALVLRLALTGAAVLILTRSATADAALVALVLAGGVAAAVLGEAFLLIPQREPARA